MAEKIRIGVIGCRVGRHWVSGAKTGEDTIAWAVADLNCELAREVAGENDVPKVYGDYRELLADDTVDAVGVATAPDVRKPMVIDALKAGKHVLVQKPHGCNAAEVQEINDVAQATGKTLVYSYFMRHQAENKKTRQIIMVKSGECTTRECIITTGSAASTMNRRWADAGCMSGDSKVGHWVNTGRTTWIRRGF